MFVKQYYLGCLAHASYLVADERTKTALVIDPRRDVDEYVEEARALGVEIRHVLLTHFHADFLAGHLELRDRVGAEIVMGARAEAEFPFRKLADGEALVLGDVRLVARETPGHTPESTCYVLYNDADDADKPHAVFTGDTLFIGDVGRPDLLASFGVTQEQLAGWLYDSLREKLLALPDETIVYPAHGAGSMCGKNLSTETSSTIGQQRQFNYALQPMTKDEFRAVVTADQPMAPGYFAEDAVLNRKERGTLDKSLERAHRALSVDEVLALANQGARVLDVRDANTFAAGHLAGSLNVGLDGKFATWTGYFVKMNERVVLVGEPGKEREAAMRLGRIGFDNVEGHLDGGFGALADRADLVRNLERAAPRALADRLATGEDVQVVDVRQPGEYEGGHIEGALSIPLPRLEERLAEVARDRDVALICKSGYRSSLAHSVLLRAGIERAFDLEGGMDAWAEAGLPAAAPQGAEG